MSNADYEILFGIYSIITAAMNLIIYFHVVSIVLLVAILVIVLRKNDAAKKREGK